MRVTVSGRSLPLGRLAAARAAEAVLRGERRVADLSIAFVGRDRMRRLNREWKRRAVPTDVLAFTLQIPGGGIAGDVYVCRWMAAREARARGLSLRQELLRLVVHGTLHVLGYDHPEGDARTASLMWKRQERYVRRLC